MQVSVETIGGLERKMTIAVPGDQVDKAVNARLHEAAKTVNLKGFRKGKVPFKIVKSRFGKGVREEVVGELMSQTYYLAIAQQSLRPVGQPLIEAPTLDEGEDLEFSAVFEVYPEISLPDFSTIKLERLTAEVTDSDIDEMIETLRRQRQTWEKVERVAAAGDMVNIDYVGRKDGETFEGGTATGTNLVLGSERMIPGFEAGIEGRSGGDNFILPLDFPGEYHSADLAGQSVEFEITVNAVSAALLPAVDDEFFASFGIEEGGEEAFREEVTHNMNREMKTVCSSKIKNTIQDALVDLIDIDLPEAMVSSEILLLRNQMLQRLGAEQDIDHSFLPDEMFKGQAGRRVMLGLVMEEIVHQQNLRADPAKVREVIEELASTYESPDEVVGWYYANEEQLAAVESSVVEEKVYDYIIEQAEVSDKQVSYQEVVRPESRAGEVDKSAPAEVDPA